METHIIILLFGVGFLGWFIGLITGAMATYKDISNYMGFDKTLKPSEMKEILEEWQLRIKGNNH